MRFVTVPFLPGPPRIWCSERYQVPAAIISDEDVDLWPYSPALLVKWVSFLNSLHWPIGDLDLGVGGISYILPGLVVLCLMAHFLFGIVLLVLLIVLQLGGYLFLVRLVAWLLLILIVLMI